METGGHTKLKERLAIRPTSETIMYETYAKWIRSHKDLPLRLNQWANVVRWEFKHCTPFLRSREFLWQEGHTAFATKEEALEEVHKILDFYEQLFRELYAVPVLKGRKSETEKFAGAEFTLSVEAFLPTGKAIQGATSHHLGQQFAKAFNIKFKDQQQQEQYVWQNSWGFSTRSIGMMILMHSDDKGLVLPPKVARIQVVIVPILFDKTKAQVLKEAVLLQKKLEKKGFSVHLDAREEYSPGWKFNEWEVKGVPVRLELGPRDLEQKQAALVRRDTGEKQALPLAGIEKEVDLILQQMQADLYSKAESMLKKSIVKINNLAEAVKHVQEKKMILAPWCETEVCETEFKEKTSAKSLNAPLQQPPLQKNQTCFACKKKAVSWFYFAKSY